MYDRRADDILLGTFVFLTIEILKFTCGPHILNWDSGEKQDKIKKNRNSSKNSCFRLIAKSQRTIVNNNIISVL